MGDDGEFVDLLVDRRRGSDFLWASRQMNPLASHRLAPELNYNRNQAIEATLSHPKVLLTIKTIAAVKNIDKNDVLKEAREMLEEMASKAHLPTVRWIGLLTVKVLKRILISFRVNQNYLLSIRDKMKNSDIQYVYVPSHRSYLDFVLMSYILFSYDMCLPNIASGMDFYRMQVVGELLRKTGAFYMRRTFSTDQLYKELFKAYVASLVEHSDRAIEFFIEGTRSRSQKSITPKYGLLAMILDAVFQGHVPDIQFIPISISYDRVLEESLFTHELLGVPKPPETTTGLFRSLSFLRDQGAHGHIHFNVGKPISARQFMNPTIRKMSALSPTEKLPTNIVKQIAYEIIESHKKNTVFMPFNLIAVLYNNQVHTCPNKPYTFENLLDDYCWLKNIMKISYGAIICPNVTNDLIITDKDELYESLKIHKNLLTYDNNDNCIVLQSTHRDIKTVKCHNVKGHNLDERTMRISVSVINLSIYVNPTMAVFTKSSIAAISITESGQSYEIAEKQYIQLRKLLSCEFALPDDDDYETIINEWEKEIKFLINEQCFYVDNNNQIHYGNNNKLRLLLCNLISPFISGIYVTASVLIQWDNETMDEPIEKKILKECQKYAEHNLFKDNSLVRHPYTLSLDLYTSSLVSLSTLGVIASFGKPSVYTINDENLSKVIKDLEVILSSSQQLGSFLDIIPKLNQQDNTLQAKLCYPSCYQKFNGLIYIHCVICALVIIVFGIFIKGIDNIWNKQ